MKQDTVSIKYRRANDFIRGELRRKKISQSTVANWLNIPQPSVSARLRGDYEWTFREIISIYELLEIEHEWNE